jgi:AcrR family transcriptional regulator
MSVGRVAATARVSKPAVYLRYTSKRKLALAAIVSLPPPKEPSSQGGTPAARVAAAIADLVADLVDGGGFALAGAVRLPRATFPEMEERFREVFIRPRLRHLSDALVLAGLPRHRASKLAEGVLGELLATLLLGRDVAKNWPDAAANGILEPRTE